MLIVQELIIAVHYIDLSRVTPLSCLAVSCSHTSFLASSIDLKCYYGEFAHCFESVK